MSREYRINEIFYSLQGEGIRAGTPNIFVRFSGCNLTCSEDDELSGFDCDTEFVSGRSLTAEQLLVEMRALTACKNIILTGGEPSLQLDDALVAVLRDAGYYMAIETNGTKELPDGLNWITVSPKSAEHTIRQKAASELKYVRHYGQGIPKPSAKADFYLLSPAFQAGNVIAKEDLEWCIRLIKENPSWRLSLQMHKFWRVR